jgi:hypothetical protein
VESARCQITALPFLAVSHDAAIMRQFRQPVAQLPQGDVYGVFKIAKLLHFIGIANGESQWKI